VTDAVAPSVDLYRATAGLPPGEMIDIDPAVVGALPPDCLLARLGIVPTHIGRGACRAEMTVGPGHLNQRGIVQAGALVAFADATAGWASYAAVESGRFTTLDLSCNLLRPVSTGDRVVAVASPVHLGRRTLVLQVAVTTDAGRPIVRFSCTQLVLGDPASGTDA
jgi:uncharacterized protein (TIGR00369 family)